ncbi:uracil-DNA glycosylase family 4 [Acetobacter sp. CAG:977]|nr:uracil-DNA glycosylase family 4 [Acetobacter sp. CAG:977]
MSDNSFNTVEILKWYQTAGVDECILDSPQNRFETSAATPQNVGKSMPIPTPKPATATEPAQRPLAADAGTALLAQKASSLEDLKSVMLNFNGCPLKNSATNMVFGTGNPNADVMIIGEAPGNEEDRQGIPFVGVSGQLLDKMLASVGLNRESVYISNVLPWHPPANRKPSEEEVSLFLPFLKRHIALVNPKILLLLGGSAVAALTGITQGITRIRGKWLTYASENTELPAMPSFHPAFLLRSPAQKKAAWHDLLALKEKMNELTK